MQASTLSAAYVTQPHAYGGAAQLGAGYREVECLAIGLLCSSVLIPRPRVCRGLRDCSHYSAECKNARMSAVRCPYPYHLSVWNQHVGGE